MIKAEVRGARSNMGNLKCMRCDKHLERSEDSGLYVGHEITVASVNLRITITCDNCWPYDLSERLVLAKKKCEYHQTPEWWPILADAIWKGEA